MKVELSLFGVFRDCEPDARLRLQLDDAAQVADLRQALAAHAADHWPPAQQSLLSRSAFASPTTVLREHEVIPSDGNMALLPPVSGG